MLKLKSLHLQISPLSKIFLLLQLLLLTFRKTFSSIFNNTNFYFMTAFLHEALETQNFLLRSIPQLIKFPLKTLYDEFAEKLKSFQ